MEKEREKGKGEEEGEGEGEGKGGGEGEEEKKKQRKHIPQLPLFIELTVCQPRPAEVSKCVSKVQELTISGDFRFCVTLLEVERVTSGSAGRWPFY